MAETEPLQAKFMDDLASTGAVKDDRWLTAFRDIPRGIFVPHYFIQTSDRSGWVLLESPSSQWATGVYSNQPLITQLGGDDTLTETARQGQPVNGVSTSSSSAPTLMALMLDALNVHDGHKILEIGTGTGYNTALLCHRVGAAQVSSIDIDPGIISNARHRLAMLGYQPHLAIHDGEAGYQAQAPFDRIIATVALPRLPQEWIDQTRIGGTILLPLDRRNCGGLLAKLTVAPGGIGHGRFLPDFGGFMPLRQLTRHDAAQHAFRTIEDNQGDTRRTSLSTEVITHEDSPFEFFAALTLPGGGWDHLSFTPSNGDPPETWLAQGDGSWACHTTTPEGIHTVRQGGHARLWDQVETAHQQWRQIGRPTRDRFGLTIEHGHDILWLDHPESPHRWALPRSANPGM